MDKKLKQAKEYFDKVKPRSKGSVGRASAENQRGRAVEAIAARREKVAELDELKKKNPGFRFADAAERDRADKLQPGPKDYPEYNMDARTGRLMVPKGWSPKKNAEGAYFRGSTTSNLGGGFKMPVDYPGTVMRYNKKK